MPIIFSGRKVYKPCNRSQCRPNLKTAKSLVSPDRRVQLLDDQRHTTPVIMR
jgi:hypothetical protein